MTSLCGLRIFFVFSLTFDSGPVVPMHLPLDRFVAFFVTPATWLTPRPQGSLRFEAVFASPLNRHLEGPDSNPGGVVR